MDVSALSRPSTPTGLRWRECVSGAVDAHLRGGAQSIVEKLTSLPFQHCHHALTTIDCQPSGPSGKLQLNGDHHALKFSQMFYLFPTPQGSFYVFNDIFRLNYA